MSGSSSTRPVAASTRRATTVWPPTSSTRKRSSSVRVTSTHAAVDDLAAVAADLLTTDRRSAPTAEALVAEVAVHVRGGGVARLAGVDDDHRAALATELERGGEPGGRSADDGDVAVALDGAVGVVAHDRRRYGVNPEICKSLAIFARPEDGGAMAELERDRTGGAHPAAQPAEHAGPVARRARRPDQPQSRPPSVGSRPASGRSASTSCCRSPAALQVDLDSLLDVHSDDDVVIRPAPSSSGGRTTWMLSRPTGSTIAVKMRLEPTDRTPEQRVHPGHDWFFVIEGRVRLLARRTRDHRRDRRGRRVRHHDAARVRRHRRPGRAHHDLRPRRRDAPMHPPQTGGHTRRMEGGAPTS